jgi:hypothetical protein
MVRLLLILAFKGFVLCMAQAQSFTLDDLLALSSLPPKNFDNYMHKRGFFPGSKSLQNGAVALSFFEKRKNKPSDTLFIRRTVDLYKKDDGYCFVLNTTSWNECLDGRKRLKKAGFLCDRITDTCKTFPLNFQKLNMTVQLTAVRDEDDSLYTFLLQKKELPDPSGIQYAEDLLQFDSHEFLVSFFGEKNVITDVYYFSEKDLKRCSVLYPNTSQQAVFIWQDEANLNKLSYVLISGILPTLSAVQYSGYISQNKWVSKTGLYSGMSLRELLRFNNNDFEFYGRESDFSFMVVPEKAGNIDFRKTGVMLGCTDCNGYGLLNRNKVSAVDALQYNLALYIFYIMIAPEREKVTRNPLP